MGVSGDRTGPAVIPAALFPLLGRRQLNDRVSRVARIPPIHGSNGWAHNHSPRPQSNFRRFSSSVRACRLHRARDDADHRLRGHRHACLRPLGAGLPLHRLRPTTHIDAESSPDAYMRDGIHQ